MFFSLSKSLHLQNQDREPKLRSLVYQRPLTISKSTSRCQTPVFAPLKSILTAKFWTLLYQRPATISKSRSWCQTIIWKLKHPWKPQIRTRRTWLFFASSKSRLRAKIWIIGILKTTDHIWIKIKMQNPSQEPPALFKVPNQDLR